MPERAAELSLAPPVQSHSTAPNFLEVREPLSRAREPEGWGGPTGVQRTLGAEHWGCDPQQGESGT